MGSRIASPELIGRERDLVVVDAALDAAAAGRARTVLIGGEAGIGKSRILGAALDRARSDGAVVLLGGCIGLAEGALPFAPIVEALRPLVRDLEASAGGAGRGSDGTASPSTTAPAPTPAPDAMDDATRRALLGVAGELGLLTDRRHASSSGAELRPEWARSRLYEAFLDLLRRLADRGPVVLAIEDLHWADDSTRELLAFLIRNGQAERLLVLITFRSDELTRRHPLLFWLAETDRAPGVERVELRRLEPDDVARQLAGILGHAPDPALVASVFERSEGNPFFAEELLAAGAETRRLPPTLREVLAARLAVVSEPTLRLLGVAAVVGRQVDHDLLERLVDLPERDLLDALHEAVAAQLLVVDETAAVERYAFRHALVGEAAAESVLPSQRRRLHVEIAEALEAAPRLRGAEEAGHLAEIAHHWFEARELSRALAAAVRAGSAAYDSSAFIEALRQGERALELWDVVPDPERVAGLERVELLRRTAQAGQLGGEFLRSAALLREAIDRLVADGDTVRAGIFRERLGRALWTAGQFNAALDAYRAAVRDVPADPPSADRARVLAGLAQVLMLGGRYRESLPLAEEAHALARATGERQIEGHSAATLGIDLANVVDEARGIALIRTALAIAEEVEDHDDIGRGYACLSSSLDLVGRVDEALAVAEEGVERLRSLGMNATYAAFVQMNAVDALITMGRWDEALRSAEAAEPVSRGNGRTFANLQLARLHANRGAFDAAQRTLEAAAASLTTGGAEAQFNGPLAVIRMELAAWQGDLDAGRRAADEGLPILEQTEDMAALAFFFSRAVRVEADASERARAARDETGLAEATRRGEAFLAGLRRIDLDALPPGYRLLVRLGVEFGEAEARRLAGASDPVAWRHAADVADARPNVFDGAYARYREAEALLAGRGSREQAATRLAQARRTALELGGRPLVEAIDGLAARARLALEPTSDAVPATVPVAPGADAIAGAGYDLTPRELEVLRLVAAGRTNRQIGEELFISESTAGVHVSRILGKLGVAGRVEAATIAARLGLAEPVSGRG